MFDLGITLNLYQEGSLYMSIRTNKCEAAFKVTNYSFYYDYTRMSAIYLKKYVNLAVLHLLTNLDMLTLSMVHSE